MENSRTDERHYSRHHVERRVSVTSFEHWLALTSSLSIVHPHPPMTRALKNAKDSLQVAGVKVVDWEPYKSMEILQLIVSDRYA